MSDALTRSYRFRFVPPYQRAVVVIGAVNPKDQPVQLGTGFFIADGGLIATAAHLFTNLNGFTGLFALRPGEGKKLQALRLGQPSVDHHHDVAAVRVLPDDRDMVSADAVLSIMRLQPEIAEVAGAFGFPHTSISLDGRAATTTTTLNFTFSAGRGLDVVRESVPFVPGGAYVCNFALDSGGSGGPVFNSNGFVTAIYSTGVLDRSEADGGPNSSVVAIEHVFDLVLPDEEGQPTVGELVRKSLWLEGATTQRPVPAARSRVPSQTKA